VGAPARFFTQDLPACGVLVLVGIGDIPAGLGGATRTYLALSAFDAPQRCSRASNPRAWAHSRRSGRALRLVCTFPRRPSAGRRVRFPQPPSSGSQIADSSLSYYRVVQVEAHALFDKGRLVVRRLFHESACVCLLGRARSRSLGAEGSEALPRWDPSTSCPCWLLNTTCGAP
jgi:hypothetical protein